MLVEAAFPLGMAYEDAAFCWCRRSGTPFKARSFAAAFDMVNPNEASISGFGRRFDGVAFAPARSFSASSKAARTNSLLGIELGKRAISISSSYHWRVLSTLASATCFTNFSYSYLEATLAWIRA
jgi:hypothetical protein